jgi:pyruvate formate lyase activating enzyme
MIFKKKVCSLCRKEDITISEAVGVCADCLRRVAGEALKISEHRHRETRKRLGLPPGIPRSTAGIQCSMCGNECLIAPGERGYCALVVNKDGKLVFEFGTPQAGIVNWYYDPHPTNCVACWVCPASTGRGYPKYAISPDGEHGYLNIAVFYGGCNLDCLFCQNWEWRRNTVKRTPIMSSYELAQTVNPKTTCVCFFGGDPSPQISHALATAREMIQKSRKLGMKVFRICWETNGRMSQHVLKAVTDLSLRTGGIIKIDFKAWTPSIYRALTGVNIEPLKKNVIYIAKRIKERPEPPLLVVSTLLVPGYVDILEIEKIAKFLSSLDPDIPYALLAFHPDYLMNDLPPTSRKHALEAMKVAREQGLNNVKIGNIFLLGDYY